MPSIVAVIDLARIRANAAYLAEIAHSPLIAVVKDDAYGHGAPEVAHALEPHAAMFAVAAIGEGKALRVAGIQKDILVLTPPLTREEALNMAAYRLTASVGSVRSLHLCARENITAHLCVNTGMNRYGVRADRAGELARAALRCGVSVEGVFSHLYAPEDQTALEEQRAAFSLACECVRECFPAAISHLAATGGVLAGVRADAARVGLGLYGYAPAGFVCPRLRPAMRVYATVSDARTPYGNGVGYARAQRRFEALHTLRVGYGDGFFRVGGLGVGNLCMDACVAEGRRPVGERVCVLEDAAAYAAAHGTSAYEVLVSVGTKAERVYRNG